MSEQSKPETEGALIDRAISKMDLERYTTSSEGTTIQSSPDTDGNRVVVFTSITDNELIRMNCSIPYSRIGHKNTHISSVEVSSLEAIKKLRDNLDVAEKLFESRLKELEGHEAIARAARHSYGKGTKAVSEDETLIRFLRRHDHTSPFEQVELIKLPLFINQQRLRHRPASLNQG